MLISSGRPLLVYSLLLGLFACGEASVDSHQMARSALDLGPGSSPFELSTRETSLLEPGTQAALIRGDSQLLAVWRDSREPFSMDSLSSSVPVRRSGLWSIRLSLDGQPLMERNLRLVSAAHGDVVDFKIAFGAQVYLVAYRDEASEAVRAVRQHTDGTLLDSLPFEIAAPCPGLPHPGRVLRVLGNKFQDGAFVVSWVSSCGQAGNQVFARRVKLDGQPESATLAFGNVDNSLTPSTLLAPVSGGYVLLRRGTLPQTGCSYQRFSASGAAVDIDPVVFWTPEDNQAHSLLGAEALPGALLWVGASSTSSTTATPAWPLEVRAFRLDLSSGAVVSKVLAAPANDSGSALLGASVDIAHSQTELLWSHGHTLVWTRLAQDLTPTQVASLAGASYRPLGSGVYLEGNGWLGLSGIGGTLAKRFDSTGALTVLSPIPLERGLAPQRGLALTAEGQTVRAVWSERDGSGRAKLRAVEIPCCGGAPSAAATLVSTASTQEAPVAASAGGKTTVLWRDDRELAPGGWGTSSGFYDTWSGVGLGVRSGQRLAEAENRPLAAAAHPTLGSLVCWARMRNGGVGPVCAKLDGSGDLSPAEGVLVPTVGSSTQVAVTASATRFLVAWRTDNSVRARLLNGSGTPVGASFDVGAAGISDVDALLPSPPAVASDGQGFLVVWRHGTERRLYAQRVTADGELVGAAQTLSMPGRRAAQPSVAWADAGYLVAWVEQASELSEIGWVRGVRLDRSGNLLDAVPASLGTGAPDAQSAKVVGLGTGWFLAYAVAMSGPQEGVQRLQGRFIAAPTGASPDGGTPVGGPPAFLSTPPSIAQCGEVYRYFPVVEGEAPISFQSKVFRPNLSVAPNTGALEWTVGHGESGTVSMSLVATNALGSATQDFQVTVFCPPMVLNPSGCQASQASLPFLGAVLLLWGLRLRGRRPCGRRGSTHA